MDALDLSRWQFGITTVYHFLFVPLTIGLSVIVASFQTAWQVTGRADLLRATRFFGSLYLVNTAMGVVTGIVQEFQFGMNWSSYSTFVGDVFGAPLALEALLAFFLEATFLGLWIFGWDRLPRRVHLATIWAAAIGSNLSAYFILSANAWMRHPVGFAVDPATGRARMTDLGAVLVNPQAFSTYVHVVGASFVVAGLFVVAVSAYRLLKHPDRDRPLFRTTLRTGLLVTALAGVVVAGSGDHQAKLMAQYEPMKLAAAEAHWETGEYAGFSLFAIGDLSERRNVIDIAVTPVLSFLATGSMDGEVRGINDLQREFQATFGPGDYLPNVPVLYWAFRLMMGLGLAGIGVGVVGLWLTRSSSPRLVGRVRRAAVSDGGLASSPARKGRQPAPWAYRVAMLGLPAALAANIFGWILTEMGRQPWTVVGELLTAASVSPGVSLGEVAFSLAAFTTVYAVLAVVEGRILWRYVKAGPDPVQAEAPAPALAY